MPCLVHAAPGEGRPSAAAGGPEGGSPQHGSRQEAEVPPGKLPKGDRWGGTLGDMAMVNDWLMMVNG